MAQAVLLYRHDTASLLRSQIESGIKKIECKGTLTKNRLPDIMRDVKEPCQNGKKVMGWKTT